MTSFLYVERGPVHGTLLFVKRSIDALGMKNGEHIFAK